MAYWVAQPSTNAVLTLSQLPLLVAGVFYFVFNAVVDFVMGRVEKRMSYYQ